MMLTCPHCNKTYYDRTGQITQFSAGGCTGLVLGCGSCGTLFFPAVDPALAPTVKDPRVDPSSSMVPGLPKQAFSSDASERYELLRQIGRGGMGTIFLARDRHSGQRVCIKTLHIGAEDEALRQEYEALVRLDHPHIVRQLDTFVQNGVSYLVIEFIEGMTLEAHLNSYGALPKRRLSRS